MVFPTKMYHETLPTKVVWGFEEKTQLENEGWLDSPIDPSAPKQAEPHICANCGYVDGDPLPETEIESDGKQRVCSKCGEAGHNARTCKA